MTVLSNQAKCLKCKEEVYSAHRHNHVSCSCGNIFVDGGMAYVRHGFMERENYMDLSIEVDDLTLNMCLSALDWCDDTKRNNIGRLSAVFRAMRDSGYLDSLITGTEENESY